MKTPMDIARYTFAKMHSRTAKECENEILYMIESAIESDRAQRDIYELIAEALDERAENWGEEMPANAAERIREGREDDYIWDDYIGPMLDRLTEELGV